jgi:signal transduction histidine kinase
MAPELPTVGGDQSLQELRRELAEAREQQATTAEILRVISSAPMDSQRVFAEIAASAGRLCDASDAAIHQVDGKVLRIVASHGLIPKGDDTLPLTREVVTGRAVLDRQTIQVADVQAETGEYPVGSANARRLGHRTLLAVPLMRSGQAIGVIGIRRTEVRPFSDRQIDLLKTFADQAVIAIENTRLIEAEQTRTKELKESLEFQTATSDVLGVISRSPTNVQPVFDTIASSAAKLCNALDAIVLRVDRDMLRIVAHHGYMPTDDVPIHRETLGGRTVIERRLIHVTDLQTEDVEFPAGSAFARRFGHRTTLSIPLLCEGEAIGNIQIRRAEVRPFTAKQIALIQTFADQAVIAIENTRLFEEVQARTRQLTESLEYQTATSEVLGVISKSPSELQPVLDAIVATAGRLCQAEYGVMFRLEDDGKYHVAAANKAEAAFVKYAAENPVATSRGSVVGRTALEKRTVHLHDCLADPEFTYFDYQSIGKYRSMLGVPLMREETAIGVIVLHRTTVEPFTDKQIGLVETFADQALIAIENTRLFEEVQERTQELTESLQQQTGTADVLKVISRSAFDLQSVLQALVESAARLCDADNGTITRQIDGVFYRAESYGFPTEVMERWRNVPVTPERGSAAGRALLEGRTVHVPDADADPDYTFDTTGARIRSVLGVPMLREGVPIGVLALARSDVRPFTDKQIELVSTFADQAAIAIENVRLFEEVQARTSELAKTVEDLEIASQHKSQFVANMSHELRTPLAAILGYAELMQEGFYEPLGQKSLDALTRIRSNGKHLLGLINTVLDIAKIESGQFTLNMAEYAIESVVETVRAATESLAQNKKVTLATSVDKLLPVGLGDEQRLTQVLLNLVGNAIKFTDAGEVRVTAKAVNGHFNVSVTDTGPGIPEEHQARIFEQFHQVDSSYTKAKGGTGLGLAIAKQIVEMHGGRIWVESTPGKGSIFQMELPTRAQFTKTAP